MSKYVDIIGTDDFVIWSVQEGAATDDSGVIDENVNGPDVRFDFFGRFVYFLS